MPSRALQEQVKALELQVQAGQARESELERQLRAAKKSLFEDEDRGIESQRLVQKLELDVLKLRQANDDLSADARQKEAAMVELRDRLDVGAECGRKLAAAQAQLAKYKARLDELSDVEGALASEMEKRSCHVEKVLALEAEAAAIPGLKKQVDDYKHRITAFELEVTTHPLHACRCTRLLSRRIEKPFTYHASSGGVVGGESSTRCASHVLLLLFRVSCARVLRLGT
jgi:chromosome segregation ATPase